MRCELNYCIYNRDFCCMLDKIELDALGACRECVFVSIAPSELQRLKDAHLAKLARE